MVPLFEPQPYVSPFFATDVLSFLNSHSAGGVLPPSVHFGRNAFDWRHAAMTPQKCDLNTTQGGPLASSLIQRQNELTKVRTCVGYPYFQLLILQAFADGAGPRGVPQDCARATAHPEFLFW